MKGLIIRVPWISLILDGTKTWEIRGSNTTIRGKIALIQSGTGLIVGTAQLVDVKPLTFEKYLGSERFHCIPNTEGRPAPYPRIHAWVLEQPLRFPNPIPYDHPQGAVIWVNLPEHQETEGGSSP